MFFLVRQCTTALSSSGENSSFGGGVADPIRMRQDATVQFVDFAERTRHFPPYSYGPVCLHPHLAFSPHQRTQQIPYIQVLTALQILGRGNCFDDILQLSLMSKSMAAATFHKFCKHFAEEVFDEHIYLPTGTYQDEVMRMYHLLGFTGAIGSTDVTHIGWAMCPFTLGRSYTGKEGFPTIAYQVTVDHAGRAIAITSGFTGATNDKTIIRYDAGVEKIKTDSQYTDREYKLRKADGTFRERKGCYLIVDNGYHEVCTHRSIYCQEREEPPTHPADKQ